MSRRLTLLAALLLAPPALPSLAALAGPGLTVTAPSPREALPGSYATLTFVAEGQGEYVFEVDSPPDWVPVTRTRTLTLSGSTLIPVTFQVPALSPAGDSPPLTLRALRGGSEVSRVGARVRVLPRAGIALRSPPELKGVPGQPLTFPLEVTNLGNQPDTVRLEATNADRLPQLDRQEVTLQPGESRSVNVSLKLDTVSEGYRYVVFFRATSTRDPSVTALGRTDSVYSTLAGREAAAIAGPRLTFSVHSAVLAGVDWSPAGRTAFLSYAVQPSVRGQLSDYVKGGATVYGLEGSLDRPLPNSLSFGLQLEGRRWAVNLDAGQNGFGVSGTALLGGWQLSPRAQYRFLPDGRLYGVGLGASTGLAGGQLDLDAGTTVIRRGEDSQRTDALWARYTRRLTPSLGLGLGLNAAGFSAAGAYQRTLFATEQLTYTGGRFDLTQTYTGSLDGIHTLSVSGGLSQVQPFGVRAAASVQLQPGGLTWSASGLVLYSNPGGFGVSLSGRVQGGTLPNARSGWQATAGATSPAFHVGSGRLSLSAAYTVGSDDDTPGALTQTVETGAAYTAGRLQASAAARWTRDPQATGGAQDRLYLAFGAASQWQRNTFSALYSYERRDWRAAQSNPAQSDSAQRAPTDTAQSLGLSWARDWTDRFSTQLDYTHTARRAGDRSFSSDQVGLTFGAKDVLTPGLGVSAGYRLTAAGGPGDRALSHSVRLGVTYDFSRVLATPEVLVKTFGGRIGGEVEGVLYRDSNLNGRQDEGEPGLAGVTVRVGQASGVSDARGHYRVRAPVGSYTLAFPAGLPATLEALQAPEVKVSENSQLRQDVAFAPVVNLEVLVYEDLDRNGRPDPGEDPIPYAGVTLSGPVSRSVQADSRGYLRLGTLPPGSYTLALDPAQIPDGYAPTGQGLHLDLHAGERPPAVSLGASPLPRQTVTTYTSGSLAVLGRLSPDTATPAGQVQLLVQTQGARSLKVEVLGQTFTPALSAGRAEVQFAVPAGTTPGTYDVTLTATGDGGNRTSVLKLLVTAPAAVR